VLLCLCNPVPCAAAPGAAATAPHGARWQPSFPAWRLHDAMPTHCMARRPGPACRWRFLNQCMTQRPGVQLSEAGGVPRRHYICGLHALRAGRQHHQPRLQGACRAAHPRCRVILLAGRRGCVWSPHDAHGRGVCCLADSARGAGGQRAGPMVHASSRGVCNAARVQHMQRMQCGALMPCTTGFCSASADRPSLQLVSGGPLVPLHQGAFPPRARCAMQAAPWARTLLDFLAERGMTECLSLLAPSPPAPAQPARTCNHAAPPLPRDLRCHCNAHSPVCVGGMHRNALIAVHACAEALILCWNAQTLPACLHRRPRRHGPLAARR
jgi:hypothetical protein